MSKPFRHIFLAAAFVFLQGQGYSNLKTLQGYEPTLVGSETEAFLIYRSMPTQIFKGKSQCHQRAHHWTYNLARTRSLKSMKIYLFFTERYKREFDYEWGYHVAPLMPVRLADGTIQEQVFDPTFTSMPTWEDPANAGNYDNKPVSIQQWIRYFIAPNVECPVVENYNDYYNFQDKHYCYILKAPMYNYIPDNFEVEKEVRTQWWEGDLKEMLNGLKGK